MSGWRALVMGLAAAGKPLPARREYGDHATTRAMGLGLVRALPTPATKLAKYELTDLGREFAAGRVRLVEKAGIPGQRGRAGRFFAATWLRALPSASQWGGL